MRRVIFLLLLWAACTCTASGQTRILQGRVAEENDTPVSSASIKVKGRSTGAVSKDDGSFSIPVAGKATLVITATGFEDQEVELSGQDNITVSLKRTGKQLDEVVVTAYGIKRSKNTLPYAAQQITGDELNQTRITNVASGLSGKVSGLQINQGNGIGGSTNVVIRGSKTLNNSSQNQALFVVDGVPISNATSNSSGERNGTGGYDYGNAAGDINPDDVESVNVLKGAAATALYGSRAGNGVILITTKKAKRGLGITVNSGVLVGTIDKSTYVKYQHEYGAGRSDPYQKDGFYYADIDGDGVKDYVVPTFAPRSWGPRFNPNIQVFGWEAFDPASPKYHKSEPWVAPANGPETFFENSVSTNNNIYMDGLLDKGSFKLGYTRSDEKGIVPNSRVQKNILNFGATYNITPKLTASATINYSKVDGRGRYGTGYDGGRNVNVNLRQYGEVNVDFQQQKVAYFRNKKNITWNWTDPTTPTGLTPAFYNNLYWTVYQNYETDTRSRGFGNVSLNYAVLPWLNVLGRVSLDTYTELQEERIAVGSIGTPSYSRTDRSVSESNYDLLITADRQLTKDLKLNALLGTNLRRNNLRSISQSTTGGLIVPNLYSIANSRGTLPLPSENYQPIAVDGYFGGLTLGYRNFLTLDGTMRVDRSSTLPKDNNQYLYFAISGSWVFSQHLQSLSWLNSGKLRANYATVGNDAPFASVSDVYDQLNPFGTSLLFSRPSTKNNSALKPERTFSREVGLEMSFLNNRIGFDASYYHTNTMDQIFPVAVSSSTGYSAKYINAGNIQNHGIELSVYGVPVRTKTFSWEINLNFTRNRNKVLDLYNNSKNFQVGSFQGGVTLNAPLGQSFGMLEAASFVMLNGQPLVNANGLYAVSPVTSTIIGNVNPDWIGGVHNTVKYKNVALSFLVDVKQGGDLFSLDMYYGQMSGILPESVGLNDLGNPKRDPVAQGGGVILPGVTSDGKPNKTRVTITSLNSTVLPQSQFVYDASYVKLRELSLSYSIPSKALAGLKVVKGIDVALIGRNLWLIHKNVPYADPEENLSAGNIQGYQSGAYPTARIIGLNAKLKF